MATKTETTNDIKVDPNALYLEEVFTDRRIGTIRRMTPVKKDGNKDTARPVLFAGETQVLTPAGALPIGFEIPAASLDEAAEKFGQLARDAIERTVKELQEMRRQAASQIVVPQGPLPPLGWAGAASSPAGGTPVLRGPGGGWTKTPPAESQPNLHYPPADSGVRKPSWQGRLPHPGGRAKPTAGHPALVGRPGVGFSLPRRMV